MKKVLIVTYGMGCGGAEKSLISFLNHMPEGLWNVDLIVANPNGIYMKQIPTKVNFLDNQYELENYATPRELRKRPICSLSDLLCQVRWQIISRFRFAYKQLSWNEKRWEIWGKYVKAPKTEYDLAISYMNGPTNYYVIDKIRAKKKVLWIHNEFEKLDVNYEYEKKYYEKADKIVTISQECVDSFVRVYPEMRDKIMVLENISSSAVITNAANAVITDEFFSYDGIKILSIGRLAPQKGYEFTIAAAEELKKRKINYVWYILGEGDLRKELQDEIEKKNLQNQVKLIGIRENPYPYIKACDIFVQTSRYEGKSIALDEAKILCKPIVVTNYATVTASIKNAVNGVIVSMNGKSVANGIIDLIENSQYRESLIRNLKSEKTGNEDEIDKYIKLIEDNLK